MKLKIACRELYQTIFQNSSIDIKTYWYDPESFDVAVLRSLSQQLADTVLSQAEEQCSVTMASVKMVDNLVIEKNSLRQWFQVFGETIVNSMG